MASLGVANTGRPPECERDPVRYTPRPGSGPLPQERRAERGGEVAGGVDQPDVGERLREVAELPPGERVVLLGQQADVVADRQQVLERPPGVLVPAEQGVVVGQPEGA